MKFVKALEELYAGKMVTREAWKNKALTYHEYWIIQVSYQGIDAVLSDIKNIAVCDVLAEDWRVVRTYPESAEPVTVDGDNIRRKQNSIPSDILQAIGIMRERKQIVLTGEGWAN